MNIRNSTHTHICMYGGWRELTEAQITWQKKNKGR